MKNKFKWVGIALLSALLIFGLTGCETGNDSGKETAAKLTKITFGAGDDTVAGTKMATAFTTKQLEAVTSYVAQNQVGDKIGAITVKDDAALSKIVTLTVSKSAKAKFIITGQQPGSIVDDLKTKGYNYKKGGVAADAGDFKALRNFITIRVKSEDGSKTNFYVFEVKVLGTDASLASITIGDITATLATASETLTVSTEVGSALMKEADNDGVLTAKNSNATTDAEQTKRYAIMPAPVGNAQPALPDEAAGDWKAYTGPVTAPSAGYQDGQRIYFEVTAKNGVNKLYYVIEIWIGREAAVASVTIQGIAITGTQLNTFSGENLASIASAYIYQSAEEQPATGFTIAAATNPDDDIPAANVKWAVGNTKSALTDLTFGKETPIKFELGKDHLYVSVLSPNGKRTVYYKIRIVLQATGLIIYGQPKIHDPAGTNKQYVDTGFTDSTLGLQEYAIDRVNTAEGNPLTVTEAPFFYLRQDKKGSVADNLGHTTAKATTRWDDDGLYVYVDVDFHDFYKYDDYERNGNFAALDTDGNIIGIGDPTNVERKYIYNNPSSQHVGDNLEVYINERKQRYTSGYYGIQYRIGLVKDAEGKAVIDISGDAADEIGGPSGSNNEAQIAAFRDSNQYNMWIKKDGAKEVGYAVVAYFPFGFIGNENADQLFKDGIVDATDYDGPELGFELQLNVGGLTDQTRACVLTWNGVGGQSWHNCFNYGSAKLILQNQSRGTVVAGEPTIKKQPKNMNFTDAVVAAGDAELPVTAAGNGALSYQWYKVSGPTINTGGSPVSAPNGTSDKLLITNDTVGEKEYYYVEVTNTRAGIAAGAKTVKSRTVTVEIFAETGAQPSAYIPLIFETTTDLDKYPDGVIDWKPTAKNYDNVIAKLDIPQGFDFSLYDSVEVEIIAYSDADATTPIENVTGNMWTATLFQPWTDYTTFPAWGGGNDAATGRQTRVLSAPGKTVTKTYLPIVDFVANPPEGIEAERDTNGDVQAVKIVSLRFKDSKLGKAPPAAPIPPEPPKPVTGAQDIVVDIADWKALGNAAAVGGTTKPILAFDSALPSGQYDQAYEYKLPAGTDFTDFTKIEITFSLMLDKVDSRKYEIATYFKDNTKTVNSGADLGANALSGPTRLVPKSAGQEAPESITLVLQLPSTADKSKVDGAFLSFEGNWSDNGRDYKLEVHYIRLLP